MHNWIYYNSNDIGVSYRCPLKVLYLLYCPNLTFSFFRQCFLQIWSLHVLTMNHQVATISTWAPPPHFFLIFFWTNSFWTILAICDFTISFIALLFLFTVQNVLYLEISNFSTHVYNNFPNKLMLMKITVFSSLSFFFLSMFLGCSLFQLIPQYVIEMQWLYYRRQST